MSDIGNAGIGLYMLRLMRDFRFADKSHFIGVVCKDLSISQERVEQVLLELQPSIQRWIELEMEK